MKRYRAIEEQFDLLYGAVEDTHTPRDMGKPGEGEILCHCEDLTMAQRVAELMNAAEAFKAARHIFDNDAYSCHDGLTHEGLNELYCALFGEEDE